MKILVACECSGRVRQALAAKGHNVRSVDLDPAEDGSPDHWQGDVFEFIDAYPKSFFDMLIAHPPCTYLANSGVRWLWREEACYASHESTYYDDARTVKVDDRWAKMEAGAAFFAKLLSLPIPKIAIENPVMHNYAREEIERLSGVEMNTHFVQPWWFGDQAFKATGFTLKGLPPLVRDSQCLVPPKPGTPEHKAWSVIHNMGPSKTRAKDRSRTFPGVARAIAEQWS